MTLCFSVLDRCVVQKRVKFDRFVCGSAILILIGENGIDRLHRYANGYMHVKPLNSQIISIIKEIQIQ